MSYDAFSTALKTLTPLKEPSKYSILCVDDEANILTSLRRMFSLIGYNVTTAESGAQGLEILAKTSFDVIISDMRMPGMDGAQFFESVRASWPEPVRILLTGNSEVSSAIAGVNQGEIYRFVTKPWVDEDLCATIKSALEYAQLRRERFELLERTRLHNVQLEERINERTQDLSEANIKLRASYVSSIKAFSNLLRLRQPSLLMHSRRVASIGMEIAKLADFDEKGVQEVYIAGLLHDIGKIGLSDRVLRTHSSELPISDLDLYRSHPVLGATFLESLDDMGGIAAMIRSHHERFDGKGYPDGLKGDSIAAGAKILCIVEAYEELKSGEASKEALTPEKAKKAIAALSGKYFCPDMVKHFLQAIEQGADSFETAPHSERTQDSSQNLISNELSENNSDFQLEDQAQTLALPSYPASNAQEGDEAISQGAVTPTKLPAKSKVGTDLPSGPKYAEFDAFVKNHPNAEVKDLRDDPNGFLWVFEGMKRYNEEDKLGEWLKKKKFVWSDNEKGWYFPII
jgi:response regulator RpfG family c-di-GMP phosphodiesterase